MSLRISVTPSTTSPDVIEILEFPSIQALADELLDDIETYPDTQSKAKPENLPLLMAVAEWHRPHRSAKNVKRMARVFAADLDELDDDGLDEVFATIEREKLSGVLWTTYGHRSPQKGGKHCLRLLIELESEYDPQLHSQVFDRFQAMFAGRLDPSTRDVARASYIPCFRQGYIEHFELEAFEGRPTSLPETAPGEILNDTPGAHSPSEPPQAPLRPADPDLVIQALKRRGYVTRGPQEVTQVSRFCRAAGDMAKGKPPTGVAPGTGTRHAFMLSVAGVLAKAFRECDPHSLAVPLAPGWHHFQQDAPDREHGLDRFAGIIADCQAKDREELTRVRAEEPKKAEVAEKREKKRVENLRQELASIGDQADAIRRHTNGKRDYPITGEEVKHLEELYGPEWTKYFIVYYKNGHYLMNPDGTHDPHSYNNDELLLAVRDRMPLFDGYIKDHYYNAKDQKVHYRPEGLRRLYATVVKSVVYDQTVRGSLFEGDTLRMGVAQPKVEPVFHEDVHEWLLDVGGEHFVDATAALTRLGETTPALILTGPGGSGKTLYGKAAAQIYGADPLHPDQAHSRFNFNLIDQPIVLHDESAGRIMQETGGTLLRQFITAGERRVEEKYLPTVTLKGFPRLIFAANNLHILDTDENLTAADRDAYSERLLHIEFKEHHRVFAQQNLELIRDEWLGKKRMAEHFLWLGENWTIKNPGKRFLVDCPKTTLHDSIASGQGVTGEVVEWMLNYIDSPQKLDNKPGAYIRLDADTGTFCVAAVTILDNWDAYMSTPKPLKSRTVQRALASLALEGRRKLCFNNAGQQKYVNTRAINLNLLRASLDQHHLTEEAFDEALGLAA